MPKRIAVTVVKIKNFRTGICDICAQRLTTSAVEQPMISNPPMISPQRMLLCSMNELSTSENGRRGGGDGVYCSYRGCGCGRGSGSGSGLKGSEAAGSSSLMNVGTGSRMTASSLATNDAVTMDG